jgi:signal transduction histidine kinase
MQQSAGRMRVMVDGLLQLSRLSTQAQPFQRVDLCQIVQEVLSDLEAQIRRTAGVVEVGELPTLKADPLQMRQLFQNLIGNALKFQPPGQAPRVKVSSSPLGPWSVQIWVEDNGIGFDLEKAEQLFQPFKRLVGKSEYEGTGLGLAICRRIVERHGGEISVRSQVGRGTTFAVTMPTSRRDTQQPDDSNH